jgi:dihydrolipoamide dehydrogenase
LGGGAIGVEFGHIMNAFGVEVTIVEMLDRILPLEDAETAAVLRKSFEKRGISLLAGTKATGVTKKKGSLDVAIEPKNGKASNISCEQMLVVVGRVPNSERLGLEQLGIKTERGAIQTGDYYQTPVKGIFAIGDVIDTPMLAHVASKEAEIAVEYMAGTQPHKRLDPHLIPSAVYCEPQVASFGYSEEAAQKAAIEYKTASFPYRGVGKAVAIEEPRGLVKILYDPKLKEILGCHIAGAEATELIHELLLAKSSELLPEDIAAMVHAHPTLSEGVMEGMRAVEGWAIHI